MALRRIKCTDEERRDARNYLREYFPPGAEIPVVLTHVSRDGLGRRFKVLAPAKRTNDDYSGRWRKGDPYVTNVSHLVARVMGSKFSDNGEIYVGGVGMDMAYAIAHDLGWQLYGEHIRHELTRSQRNRVKATEESSGSGYYFRSANL